MEDILKSIKAFLYDRAASPLFGAFLISWGAWNYRFFIILLSDEAYGLKFNSIDKYIASHIPIIPWGEITTCFYAGNGFLFPLLTALAYIYVYPIAAEPVYKYSLGKQKSINKLKKEANDSRIIDEKDSRKLFKNLTDIQVKYDEDISQYQKQVEALKIIIDEKSKKFSEHLDLGKVTEQEIIDIIKSKGLNIDIRDPKDDFSLSERKTKNQNQVDISNNQLSTDQINALISIAHSSGWVDVNTVKLVIEGKHRLKAKSILEDLVEKGYSKSNNDGAHYQITPEGEKYLLDNKII